MKTKWAWLGAIIYSAIFFIVGFTDKLSLGSFQEKLFNILFTLQKPIMFLLEKIFPVGSDPIGGFMSTLFLSIIAAAITGFIIGLLLENIFSNK